LSKCDDLKEQGAHVVTSPEAVARESDVVFSMVGFPEDVREVLLSPSGVVPNIGEEGIVVDMTTSSPSLAVEIAETGDEHSVFTIDAPVSGGDIGARNATLSIMLGGNALIASRISPLLNVLGTNIKYMGGPGMGQHTKMMNQILIATNMIGMCEGLMYAAKAGLPLQHAIDAVSAGAAGSWSISNLGPRIVRGDYEPGFMIEHFVKDMAIALDECERLRIVLPGLDLAHTMFAGLKKRGHGRSGTQALQKWYEALNRFEMPIQKPKE
jgi:3-hydroxyisobutyrate dehydrogenase